MAFIEDPLQINNQSLYYETFDEHIIPNGILATKNKPESQERFDRCLTHLIKMSATLSMLVAMMSVWMDCLSGDWTNEVV